MLVADISCICLPAGHNALKGASFGYVRSVCGSFICKRTQIRFQKATFYRLKGRLLEAKRTPFATH